MESKCTSGGAISPPKDDCCGQGKKSRVLLMLFKVFTIVLLVVLLSTQLVLWVYTAFSSTEFANNPVYVLGERGNGLFTGGILVHVWMDQAFSVVFLALLVIGFIQCTRVKRTEKLSALFYIYVIISGILPMLYAFSSDVVAMIAAKALSEFLASPIEKMLEWGILNRFKLSSLVVLNLTVMVFVFGLIYSNIRNGMQARKLQEIA